MSDNPTDRIWKECVQCENDFYIKEEDQKFFESKNLALPKRCWSCRQKNKKEAIEAKMRQADAERKTKISGSLRRKRAASLGMASTTTKIKRKTDKK